MDFAGNRTKFILRGNPASTLGRKSRSVFCINSMPQSTLTVSFGDSIYVFRIVGEHMGRNNPMDIANYQDSASLRAELVSKIAENYYIMRHYEVSVDEYLNITFVSKEYGGDVVSLDGHGSGDIDIVEQSAGIARVEYPNYQVFAKFEVSRCLNGALREEESPEMFLHLDEDDTVEVPTEILRSFFSQVDLPDPRYENLAAYPLRYAILKCRLTYTEAYGQPLQIGVFRHSRYIHLLSGRIDGIHHLDNLPDWNTEVQNERLSYYDHVRDFGCATGLTVRSFFGMPQYAYFLLFNNYEDENYTSSIAISVIAREKSGEIFIRDYGQISIPNFKLVRIPLSAEALELALLVRDILSYTVVVKNGTGLAWKRTYLVERKPYNAQVFLLQNRYGLLESVYAVDEAIEEDTQGTDTVKNGVVDVDITDTSTVYTARLGFKSTWELSLAAEAMRGRFNFRVINEDLVIPIAIIPDTLTIVDTAEDLLSIEFQYRFKLDNTLAGWSAAPILPREPITIWEDERMWSDGIRFETDPSELHYDVNSIEL